MATHILHLDRTRSYSGLNTYTYTFTTSDFFNLQFESTEDTTSTISVVVNQNGSPIFTQPALSGQGNQNNINFKLKINATAADTLSVVVTSSAAIDNQLNTVKTTISIGSGF